MSVRTLGSAVAALAEAVRREIDARRATDPSPADPFRGLYITDDDVDRLLARPGAMEPGQDRLGSLAERFALDDAEVAVLIVAVAPDLDARFERLYAYLHDDVSRRRASIGLAMRFAGALPGAFHPDARLLASGLLVVEEGDRPFLTRSLRVPDRVALHLLGDDTPHPTASRLAGHVVPGGPIDPLVRALQGGSPLVYLRQRGDDVAAGDAVASLAAAGLPSIVVDLRRIEDGDDPAGVARIAVREARLAGAGLVAGPIDALARRGAPAVRAFAEAPCPIVLTGSQTWEPGWSRATPLLVDAAPLGARERASLWLELLGDDAAEVAAAFRLSREQIVGAAAAAAMRARALGRAPTAEDVRSGARAQNGSGLERFARRIDPIARWSDLVLPADTVARLRELPARIRHRERVLTEWRVGGRHAGGVRCLFAGQSGTGKTLAAEVVAADLGLDLYVIDLSAVVDKYVGETEKNLERIFREAEHLNGVLLFDEADALFGKRSEVKDARDRWANVEVSYLLQRMERFDGIAILTTNLRANVDEAFTRRLDVLVDFPLPDQEARLALWRAHLGGIPSDDDLDWAYCARSFDLTGGNIRNIALTAAFLAAADEAAVSMAHVVAAVEREYRKLGRLCLEAEFGPYFSQVAPLPHGEPGDAPPGARGAIAPAAPRADADRLGAIAGG